MPPKLSNRKTRSLSVRARFSQRTGAFSSLLLDAIYPPRCAGCHDFCESLFCAPCRKTLRKAPLSQAIRASREPSLVAPETAPHVLPARAVFLFEGALREAVHRFKYEGKTALAAPLAQLMLQPAGESENLDASTRALFEASASRENAGRESAGRESAGRESAGRENAGRENAGRENAPILVPVPLHAWRKWRRGYNQSELLARELSRLTSAPHLPLLRRTRYTATQTELSREERTQNVEGAFAPDEKIARVLAARKTAPSFVLIDDVLTTGATLEECARVLRRAFPHANVRAVALAYQPPH